MPVGFSSAARNLFLLGSSGADAVTNFFKAIDKSSNPNEGQFLTSQIKYNYSDQKFLLSGTGLGNDSFGWVEKRDYNGENGASTDEWGVRINPTVYSSALTLTTIELDSNNDIIVVGKNGGVNGDYGTEAPYIAKYSNAGVLDWQSTSYTGDVEYTGVTSDSNGNYYACGNTPDTQITFAVSGEAVAFVEKFDSNGNPGWGKSALMLGRDVVLNKIASNSRGEIVAVGYLADDSAAKGYIVKIDSNTGNILWDRTIKSQYDPDGLDPYQDVICKDIFIDSNDQIYIVGNKYNHGFIIKYTSEGNIIWQKQTDEGLFNAISFEQVFSDSETDQAVVFGTYEGGLSTKNGILSKYSKNGDLIWRRFLKSSSDSSFAFGNISLDADPSFYYLLFRDQQISGQNPLKYTFGKVSSSGNGLGDFQYSSDGSTTIEYKILNSPDQIGRLSDGSVTNSVSDLIAYPFSANKLVFDDLATHVSNKRRQMDSADSFEYSGSPAVRVADFQELNLLGDVYSGSGDWLDQSGKGNDATTLFTTTAEEPFSGAGSVEFDGSGDYLSFATSSNFALGTGDWTVEWFAYPTSDTQYQRHFYLEGSSSSNIDGVFALPSGIAFGRTNVWATSETSHPLNQWNHYALVHDSTNMRLYLNGVEVLTTANNFGTDATKSLNIGYSNSTYGGYFTGNISNFRILNGTALYTSNFTPPTSALTNTGQTISVSYSTPIYSSMLTAPNSGTVKTPQGAFNQPHSMNQTGDRSEGVGGLLFTPTTPIPYSSQVEVLDNNTVTACWFNQTSASGSSTQHSSNYVTVATGSGTITSMYFQRTDNAPWDAGFVSIRVDGVNLEDTVSSPDDTLASNKPPSQLFDGNLNTRCESVNAGGTVRWTPATTTTWGSSLRINTGAYSGSITVRANGTTTIIHPQTTQVQSPYWTSHPDSSGTIEYIEAQGHIGAGTGYMVAIEIDGTILVDSSGSGTTGTMLLTAQGSSITDASDSNLSIAVNGDAVASVGSTSGPTYNAAGYWEFDNVGDNIEIGTLGYDYSQLITLEAWIKTTDTDTWNQIVCGEAGDILWAVNQGKLNFGSQTNTPIPHNNQSTASINTGNWVHVLTTFDGANIKHYINGEFDSTFAETGSLNANEGTHPLRIGARGTGTGEYFGGSIGEVRIYPRALTAAQVFQNYNATKSKYINEAPDTAPKIGPGIVHGSNLILNYDFGNRATYDTAQNLIPNSEDFTKWNQAVHFWENNYAIAPDGTKTAALLKESIPSQQQLSYHNIGLGGASLVVGETYTFSVYAKANTRDTFEMHMYGDSNVSFNLTTGSSTSTSSMTDVGDGWWLCKWVREKTNTAGIDNVYLGFSGSTYAGAGVDESIFIWHPQFERDVTRGRYIKTSGISITAPTTVKNLSSSPYTGTISGPTFNSAGYFETDGASDNITIPGLSLSGTGGFTVELWMKFTGLQSNAGGWNYFLRDEDGLTPPQYEIGVYSNDNYSFAFKQNSIPDAVSTVLTQNQWHHICFGVNASQQLGFIYKDGVYAGGSTNSFSTGVIPLYKLFGNFDTNTGLSGQFGEIRGYDDELSGAEVLQNFNATKSKYGL